MQPTGKPKGVKHNVARQTYGAAEANPHTSKYLGLKTIGKFVLNSGEQGDLANNSARLHLTPFGLVL